MKKFLLLVPLVAALAVVLIIRDGGSADGPLDSTPAGHASPMITGDEYDHFSVLLFNRGKHPIELERVRLAEVAGPVELVEVRGRRANEEFVGGAGGGGRVTEDGTAEGDEYPSEPLSQNHTLSVPVEFSADGIDPVQAFQVLFRVRMTKAGVAQADAVLVDYTSNGKRYSETFKFRSTWCAPRDVYAGPTATKECEHDLVPRGDRVLG